MKKNLLFAIAMCLAIASMGQITGGGDKNQTQESKSVKNGSAWTSGNFGLSAPIGKFGKNDLSLTFDEAAGAKSGIFIDWTSARYFNETTPTKFGLMQKIAYVVNFTDWEAWAPGGANASFSPFMLVEYKIGAVGTYSASNDLALDGFLLLGVDLGLGGQGYWDDIEFYPDGIGVGFGWSLGAAVRVSGIRISMSIDPTKLGMDYTTYDSGSSGSSFTTNYKVPMSTFRLGIGFFKFK